ncbi:MAG: hypothetical protein IJW46_06445, partial [Clostridia bacterium]|nr:hypothetical protein [Clostridia bacterium]
HNTPGIKKIENTYFGYAGSLEPRAFNDRGERGAYKIEISKTAGIATCRPAFFRLAKRIYAVDTLDISGKTTYDAIASAMSALFKEKNYGADTLLRLEITGSVPPEIDTAPKKLAALAVGLFYCEIIDHTSPEFNIDALKDDPTIKGELVRTLLPCLESTDEEERRRAYCALKYALLALSGNDIADF